MAIANYTLTLDIEVSDEDALMDYARDRAVEQGCERSDVTSVANALVWIFDDNEVLRDCGAQIIASMACKIEAI